MVSNKMYQIALEDIKAKDEKIQFLMIRLEEARDLKELLGQLTKSSLNVSDTTGRIITMNSNGHASLSLPEDVARYVPDHFGGKVIRQEATKVVILDKQGNVLHNCYTKQKADKGYSYKLIRE